MEQNLTKRVYGWLFAAFSTLLAFMWTLFTYIIPDPTVLGLEWLNWQSTVVGMSVLVVVVWLLLYGWLQRFHAVVKHSLLPLSFITVAFLLFQLGFNLNNPLFQQNYKKPVYKENTSPTLLGKRVTQLKQLSVEFLGCHKEISQLACQLALLNQNEDQDFAFNYKTKAFDNSSNELELKSLLVGNKKINANQSFDLSKGVKRSVTLIFDMNNTSVEHIATLRLHFDNISGDTQGIKFTDIPL